MNHYKSNIEAITFIIDNKLDFCLGNIVKYVTRYKKKDGAVDIQKAINYAMYAKISSISFCTSGFLVELSNIISPQHIVRTNKACLFIISPSCGVLLLP